MPDSQEQQRSIVRAIELIVAPGHVTGLRALDASTPTNRWPHTVSGYFNDPDALAEAALSLRSAKGTYVTLNPVQPALSARANNRVRDIRTEPLTSDGDIIERRWLPVDIDPRRPADISSSDDEHDAAIAMAEQIRTDLCQLGWPEPILADSGNGAHLLYRINLPRDDGGLVQRCLDALACKGDSTSDRPHRLSQILDVPETLEVVASELLDELAASVPPAPTRSAPHKAHGRGSNVTSYDLADWIATHEVDVVGPTPWNDGTKYVFPVCPWNPDHTNRSAYIVQFANGAIAAGCHHNSCQGNGWQELRALVEGVEQLIPVDCANNGNIATRVVSLAPLSGAPDEDAWEPPLPFVSVPVPNFPTDTLSEWLRAFAEAEAVATQTPPDLAAMLCLAICGHACAKMVDVVMCPDWREPLNLFAVVALPPGSRKSAVFRHVVQPVEAFEAELVANAQVTVAERDTQRMVLEARCDVPRKSLGKPMNGNDQLQRRQRASSPVSWPCCGPRHCHVCWPTKRHPSGLPHCWPSRAARSR